MKGSSHSPYYGTASSSLIWVKEVKPRKLLLFGTVSYVSNPELLQKKNKY
jgi:hypothetical protein